MNILTEVDKLCFVCSLYDCIEKDAGCKRKIYLKEKREYKEKQEKQKMDTVLEYREPLVIR